MYAEALAERRIFCSEKMVLKLGLVIMALAVFSGYNMPLDAYEARTILRGYIQENTMYKEQSDDALFLLQKKWAEDLKEKYPNQKITKVDDGVVYVPIVKYINSRRVKINVAEINRNINKNIEIIPQMGSDKMHSRAKINNIAMLNGAILAINGTYFKQDTGTPLGALVINNEIISGPIYERVGLGIGEDSFETSRISFNGEIKTKGKTIKIDNINQPRMLASNVLIYTSKWGEKSPKTKTPSIHIAIKDDKVITKSSTSIFIPIDGYVISAPKDILADIKAGDKVKIDYSLSPRWSNIEHLISGGPYLMKDGEIFLDVSSEKLNAIAGRNPRTAIGYTKDNVLIMVTVDGRKEGSTGVTLKELAKLMKQLGCYEAINLDGGSSTVMYVDGKIYTGSNIKTSVAINNALVVRKKV